MSRALRGNGKVPLQQNIKSTERLVQSPISVYPNECTMESRKGFHEKSWNKNTKILKLLSTVYGYKNAYK
jgi:hypothetical protein